jgi:hypothetical protein
VGVAATGWLVDRTGTYTAGFALTAGVGVAGALVFGMLFDARPSVANATPFVDTQQHE